MKEQLNESNRLLFTKSRGNWLGNNIRNIGFVCCVCLLMFGAWRYINNLSVFRYEAGYQAGLREALNTRNPSQELELACGGLWIGEQNKKYQKQK